MEQGLGRDTTRGQCPPLVLREKLGAQLPGREEARGGRGSNRGCCCLSRGFRQLLWGHGLTCHSQLSQTETGARPFSSPRRPLSGCGPAPARGTKRQGSFLCLRTVYREAAQGPPGADIPQPGRRWGPTRTHRAPATPGRWGRQRAARRRARCAGPAGRDPALRGSAAGVSGLACFGLRREMSLHVKQLVRRPPLPPPCLCHSGEQTWQAPPTLRELAGASRWLRVPPTGCGPPFLPP